MSLKIYLIILRRNVELTLQLHSAYCTLTHFQHARAEQRALKNDNKQFRKTYFVRSCFAKKLRMPSRACILPFPRACVHKTFIYDVFILSFLKSIRMNRSTFPYLSFYSCIFDFIR